MPRTISIRPSANILGSSRGNACHCPGIEWKTGSRTVIYGPRAGSSKDPKNIIDPHIFRKRYFMAFHTMSPILWIYMDTFMVISFNMCLIVPYRLPLNPS
jgi:hypothetical protein